MVAKKMAMATATVIGALRVALVISLGIQRASATTHIGGNNRGEITPSRSAHGRVVRWGGGTSTASSASMASAESSDRGGARWGGETELDLLETRSGIGGITLCVESGGRRHAFFDADAERASPGRGRCGGLGTTADLVASTGGNAIGRIRRRGALSTDRRTATPASVRTRPRLKLPREGRLGNADPSPEALTSGEETAAPDEPTSAVLRSVTEPLIPRSIWEILSGREFLVPSCLSALTRAGIKTATDSDDIIDWKPNKQTKGIFEEEENSEGGSALRESLDSGEVLVWTGRFKVDGYGSELPLVKTAWTINMPPRDFAELLMDSARVKSYNKMSLGRTDIVNLQRGVDTEEGEYGNGEAKIVRNLTKPPLSKRDMEFITLMHARKLRDTDRVGAGIMGGDVEGGFVVVSRAVGGSQLFSDIRGGGSSDGGDERLIRSEILLGVNIVRSIPGQPQRAEVTAVTHCNSPSIPTMLAGKIGVKGAVDFVKDIRALCP